MKKEGPGQKNIVIEMTTALTEKIEMITMKTEIVIIDMKINMKDRTTTDIEMTGKNLPL